MKTVLLTIGFVLGGILTPFAAAQVVPLTVDSTQSSVEISIAGSPSSSQLSGNVTFDIESSDPPSGSAQITDLTLVLDESISASVAFGLVTASTSPGDVSISLVTPGAAGTISGTSFAQLGNLISLVGDLDVSDPLGLAGGNQTVDLSTIEFSPFDLDSVEVTQSGDIITISSTFTFAETLDFGAGPTQVEVAGNFVASGAVPASVLLGDVNMDGEIDFLDITPFISILSTGGFQEEADIDQNGVVDFMDISPFIELLSGQ